MFHIFHLGATLVSGQLTESLRATWSTAGVLQFKTLLQWTVGARALLLSPEQLLHVWFCFRVIDAEHSHVAHRDSQHL